VFVNILSVLGASPFLPFVPMTPRQILTNNLLYDCSQVPISIDEVDAELTARPRPWSMRQISRFILLVGPCSSIFDDTTAAVMLAGIWLVQSPFGRVFGFAPLPGGSWPILGVTLVAYAVTTHGVKMWLVRRQWID